MKLPKKKVELPVLEPLYSAYHYQGAYTACMVGNPSLKNLLLNDSMILTCTRKFLNGFTTPELDIRNSSWVDSVFLEKKFYSMQHLDGQVNYVIRKLLDEGYYVYFTGVDDFYVKGKSWYHEKHHLHDGCICGYDQSNKTYCIYAYDQKWIYRKFWTTQASFNKGRKSSFKMGTYGNIHGLKPKQNLIAFSRGIALKTIAEYLDSNLDKYPESGEGVVSGIVVHNYIAKYIGKLYDASIPHSRMDRRIFRIIWEQKNVMQLRIQLIEKELNLGNSLSEKYKAVVDEANTCRMLYASHHMKERRSVLPVIQKKLLNLKAIEEEVLTELLKKSKWGDYA